MLIAQYIVVGILALGALVWLFRKKLFPKKYNSSSCGDGDCGCH